jgi:hypothetical protein
MEAVTVSETLETNFIRTWLVAREYLIMKRTFQYRVIKDDEKGKTYSTRGEVRNAYKYLD